MLKYFKDRYFKDHRPGLGALEILKYIGPGLLVTVGFIDPGNWASNIAAGSEYGYLLLWMVTLSTIMLIVLQHNVAHLGIATGLCLSEAATIYTPRWISRCVLTTAMMASVSTSLAEILGGAIALNMLFHIPVKVGAVIILSIVIWLLLSNSYRMLEKYIIGFVSIIGLSFIYELTLVEIRWSEAVQGWLIPVIPEGSIIVVMSVLGAVVMPHNLFLHSEIIQSRQWNLQNETVIQRQLKYEFADTLFSMIVGWAINSAMILLAASTFYHSGIAVTELQQARKILTPLLGSAASVIFAVALLFAGVASSITSGMAGGSIFSGLFSEPYDIKDSHTKLGVIISLCLTVPIIFLIGDPYRGLILSQMMLSIQLPFTIFLQIYLTSSRKVMGKYVNTNFLIVLLVTIGLIVAYFNMMLLRSLF
ncbi:MAG: divalent metal cation transporter [Deltaproteobacteria bacterium]|nr:MAG: divalent metal cation transporter [Deltaproteobacteria bacterium]